jgi:hypothetical protein
LSKQKPKDMTGWQLHDTDTQEIMGSVIITHRESSEIEDAETALHDAWHDFNRAEETEDDHTDVDAFVEWFNESHVTQIERLYLEFIQHYNGDE